MKGIEKGRTGLAEERNCNNEVTMFCSYLASLGDVVSLGSNSSQPVTEECLKEKAPDTLSELHNP